MQSGIRNRGFASMDAAKQREIARKGGRAAHARGTAHEFSVNEARAAGRKGGESVSANRDHMSRIGRIGGKNSAGRRAASRTSEKDAGPPGMPVAAEAAAGAPQSSEAMAEAAREPKRNPDAESPTPPGQPEVAGDAGVAAA